MGRTFENRKQTILKRGARDNKLFTRAARQIAMAIKHGGSDPEANPALKRAIQNARAVNMPKDKIQNNIDRAAGNADTSDWQEALYEGYGPHGVAIIVEAATDNPTRTAANVRSAFKKGNGNMGATGSVSFMFDKFGVFRISPEGIDREELELELIDHGLEEIVEETDEKDEPLLGLRCAFEEFGNLQTALDGRKIEVASSGFVWIPKTETELGEEQMEEVLKLVVKLEDDDDVQDVFTNLA